MNTMNESRKKLVVWLSAQADQRVYTTVIVDVPSDFPEDDIEDIVAELGPFSHGWRTVDEVPAPADLNTVEIDACPQYTSPVEAADCYLLRDENGRLTIKGSDDR